MKIAEEIVDAIIHELKGRRLSIYDMVDYPIYLEIRKSLIEIVQGRLRLSGYLSQQDQGYGNMD